ncbi:MAG TPA: hypothetical protein PKG54_13555 [Phycisphaerae bacterium]|jgi:hypothetical protein|nr:hypothetical protein [Phycisphaerae bacterium]HOB75538.1 hypothetical protein [Phycisphaerae bacterium]HPU33637.1 hypothetical protein [Phycisphaerae bacterium]HQA44165.1 hypothetical protein [Phycisphaerae bacterium]HXK88292.1 hypothetical protein [Phycisphaerae bacterium]
MSLSDLMSHPSWIHLGLSLVHFLWQGVAIAMLLAMALFATRRYSPELRYGLCLFAMLAMALCPAATLWYFHSNPPAVGLTLSRATTPEPEAQARANYQPDAQARANDKPDAQARSYEVSRVPCPHAAHHDSRPPRSIPPRVGMPDVSMLPPRAQLAGWPTFS